MDDANMISVWDRAQALFGDAQFLRYITIFFLLIIAGYVTHVSHQLSSIRRQLSFISEMLADIRDKYIQDK